jgi:cytochrome c-type biogenesis protein CcmF
MVEVGQISLVIALLVAGYATLASFLGAGLRMPELALSGRYGLYALPLLLIIPSMSLVDAFVSNDFSVRYVAENSNLAMPVAYTWVAMYAGNAGSLLFLALVLSGVSVIAIAGLSRKLPHTGAYAAGILMLTLTFFLAIIVGLANPLERLPITPTDGQGINPLLVHFGMFIHPPVQMTGLVLVTVPFSIAMGAMMAGRGGHDEWVSQGRLWGMITWVVLTIGLLLGAWWAYTILGWGGYWAWDPVENSALMPWLAMTAFVHSIMVQKRRGMFRMWNMVLIITAFAMAQMGMFINRGGPVPSVHSFAESSMGWLFLAFMGFTLLGSLIAFWWRSGTLKSRETLDSMLCRESIFLLQNVLFLTVALVTLWGTIFPIFSDVAQDETVTVGAPFFNRVNGPIILALVALMGIGPLLPWRRATRTNVVRALKYPVAAGIVTAVVLALLGIGQPVALAAFSICALVVTGIIHEWVRGTMSRHRSGESYPIAFGRLLARNRPRYGGYVVHLAIIMLAVGAIGSSFYGVQRDMVLRPGDTGTLGDYSFKYLRVEETLFADRVEEVAELEVYSGDSYLGLMRPFRAFYPDFRIAATRGAIRSTPIEDFYIVPSEFNEDGRAVFRILINPLVWWMWAAGPLLFAGVVLGLWPQRQPAPATLTVRALSQAARA